MAPTNGGSLAGRTAVVTGAGSGIGRALVVRFARAGMNVVLADVEEPAMAETATLAEAAGAGAAAVLCHPTDVRRLDHVEALLTATIDRFGRADVVCNNAGVVGPFGVPVEQMSTEDWRWVLDVDLWGVINGIKVFVPHLLVHGDGHVVNTASLAGLTTGAVINAAYHAAKHAVVAISECLYHDLAARSATVGVSVLCPGFVQTRIMDDRRNRPEDAIAHASADETVEQARHRAALAEMAAAGRPPSEIADLVLDAIEHRRFYIHTDAAAMPFIAARHAAIQSASLPATGELDLGLAHT